MLVYEFVTPENSSTLPQLEEQIQDILGSYYHFEDWTAVFDVALEAHNDPTLAFAALQQLEKDIPTSPLPSALSSSACLTLQAEPIVEDTLRGDATDYQCDLETVDEEILGEDVEDQVTSHWSKAQGWEELREQVKEDLKRGRKTLTLSQVSRTCDSVINHTIISMSNL